MAQNAQAWYRKAVTTRLVKNLGHLIPKEVLESDEQWEYLKNKPPPTDADYARWGWPRGPAETEGSHTETAPVLQLEDKSKSASSSSAPTSEPTADVGKKEATAPQTETPAAEPTATA